MTIIEIIKKQIEILKKLIRSYQLQMAIKKNEPKPTQSEVLQWIRTSAKTWGVDTNLAIKVANCESGLDPFAINFNSDGSVDRGLYQWNDKYHPEITDEMAFNYIIATNNFCRAVKQGYLSWWNSSKSCWSK